MIKKTENQTSLKFGIGDICVVSGTFINENDFKVGIVGFIDQTPREIGSIGEVKAGQNCKVGDFPVMMKFYKKESIDEVIKALLDAKEQMD